MAKYLVGCVLYDSLEKAIEEAKERLKRECTDWKAAAYPIYKLLGYVKIDAAPPVPYWEDVE